MSGVVIRSENIGSEPVDLSIKVIFFYLQCDLVKYLYVCIFFNVITVLEIPRMVRRWFIISHGCVISFDIVDVSG